MLFLGSVKTGLSEMPCQPRGDKVEIERRSAFLSTTVSPRNPGAIAAKIWHIPLAGRRLLPDRE